MGIQKAAACWWPSFWIVESQGHWSGDQNSLHHWAPYSSPLGKARPTGQHWLYPLWCPFLGLLEGRVLGWEEGDGRGACRGSSLLCRLYLLMDLQLIWDLGQFNFAINVRFYVGFNVTQESGFSFWHRGDSAFSFYRSQEWCLNYFSPLRTNRGAMHHCSFHATPHRTPVGNPDSLVWACSTLAKAMVFCCLIIWKLEEVGKACSLQGEVWGLQVKGPPSCCFLWAQGSWNTAGCQWTMQRASDSLRLSHRTWENIVIQPQGISVSTSVCGGSSAFLHGSTWWDGSLDLVHLAWLGWLMDDQSLDLASLMRVKLHWGSSSQSWCSVSIGPGL